MRFAAVRANVAAPLLVLLATMPLISTMLVVASVMFTSTVRREEEVWADAWVVVVMKVVEVAGAGLD